LVEHWADLSAAKWAMMMAVPLVNQKAECWAMSLAALSAEWMAEHWADWTAVHWAGYWAGKSGLQSAVYLAGMRAAPRVAMKE